jgi:3-phenylpropionate/trans-cinnamate dioxygenase ferredoxin component
VTFERVAPSGSVTGPRFTRVEVGGRPVLVTRLADGTPVAFHPTCPHQDNPMDDGSLWEGEIDCPFHHYTYDPRTGANCFPAKVFPRDRAARVLGIPVFEVKEEDGWVLVGPRRVVEGVRTEEDQETGEGAA